MEHEKHNYQDNIILKTLNLIRGIQPPLLPSLNLCYSPSQWYLNML